MKKKFVICGMIILSLFTVGCEKTIELTDEENHLIAEYAAELLIKYDRNMNYKYDSSDVVVLTTEAVTTEDKTEQEADISTSTDAEQTATDAETSAAKSEEFDKTFDIASFAGEENISIKYSDYTLTDRYPSYNQDGMCIEVEATEGYKLLVLNFDVVSNSEQEQYVDLYDDNLEYSIVINDTKSAKQMLTILMDDLYTYQETIEAGTRHEAVLLFQVSDAVADDIKGLKLKVTRGDEEKIIVLQ